MSKPLDRAEVLEAFGTVDADFLGHGTFSETWRVTGLAGDDIPGEVAVKILHPDSFNKKLLAREVTGLRKFNSQGVVKLHDAREVDFGSEVRTVLVCEYIVGGDVMTNLRLGAGPSIAEIIGFALALLTAVKELHSAEFIHRDIKFENILLRDGRWEHPVLIDFGLSRSLTEATLTRYPTPVGTVPYMSPEQLRGEKARKAADLWACGVVLYQLIAKRHPFVDDLRGLDIEDVLDLVTGSPKPMPPHVPVTLDNLVTQLLSISAYQRGSAKRVVKELKGMVDA